MFKPRSEFLTVLTDRGFLQQCTDLEALDALALTGPVTGYIGFDATADSLHVGSLLQIMTLHWMQQTGHRPVCCIQCSVMICSREPTCRLSAVASKPI